MRGACLPLVGYHLYFLQAFEADNLFPMHLKIQITHPANDNMNQI
jgi:hypothetical protein